MASSNTQASSQDEKEMGTGIEFVADPDAGLSEAEREKIVGFHLRRIYISLRDKQLMKW